MLTSQLLIKPLESAEFKHTQAFNKQDVLDSVSCSLDERFF